MVSAVLATAILAAGVALADDKGKALFEAKCAMCHPLSRSLSLNKARDGWTATVARMKKNGCPLTDDEAKTIVDHLVKVRGPAAGAK